MRWSIVEVARMSGVTARTLRHYDEIGLLPPAGVGANGYRMYGEAELLRLQEVLVLRQLGLGLADIAAVLDREVDRATALRAHHERLVAERDRLSAVAATVERTIRELEEGAGVMERPEDLFEGFDESAYAKEAEERWPAQYASSKAYVDTLTPEQQRGLGDEWIERMRRMADLRASGAAPGDARTQEEVDDVYRGLTRMWTPNAAAFRGLGDMYVDDERYTASFDRVSPGLAGYFRDAMHVYADARLT